MQCYAVFLILVLLACPLLAEESAPVARRDVPLTLSIAGPVSSNFRTYETTNSYFCLGLINCSLANSYVLSLTVYGYNITEYDMEGVSIGTLGNFALRDARGVQMSFIANTATRSLRGFQLSFANVVLEESLSGAQIGAFNMNFGDTIGAQVGLFNYTQETATGLQLGVINAVQNSDEEGKDFAVQYGVINYAANPRVVPIGLINIVQGGRFQVELNRSVLGVARIDLILGSPYFYSIWSLDSYEISPRQKKENTNKAAELEGLGFGLGIPFDKVRSLRVEDRKYFPTKSRLDEARVVRVVVERRLSYGFAVSIGLERNRFRRSAVDRSGFALSKTDAITSMTAGFSWNLMNQGRFK